MKKVIFILLIISSILVIFTLSLYAAEATKYDFRKTNWGMSKEQVKATEDAKLDIEDDSKPGCFILAYSNIKIDGRDSICVYYFLEDKLYQSAYGFLRKHSNDNFYIDDYENLKGILTKKYGKPVLDNVTWRNDLFKDDKQSWGLAVSIGHLEYFSSWETSTTYIMLGLDGDNYKIDLTLGYSSRELEEWVKKIKEEQEKSQL